MELIDWGDIKGIIYYFFLFITLLFATKVFADWTGPNKVVSTGLADEFPKDFGVDYKGNIFKTDQIKNRILIFDSKGSLINTINPPSEITHLLKNQKKYWVRLFYVLCKIY